MPKSPSTPRSPDGSNGPSSFTLSTRHHVANRGRVPLPAARRSDPALDKRLVVLEPVPRLSWAKASPEIPRPYLECVDMQIRPVHIARFGLATVEAAAAMLGLIASAGG